MSNKSYPNVHGGYIVPAKLADEWEDGSYWDDVTILAQDFPDAAAHPSVPPGCYFTIAVVGPCRSMVGMVYLCAYPHGDEAHGGWSWDDTTWSAI